MENLKENVSSFKRRAQRHILPSTLPSVTEGSNTREYFAFQELHGCTTTRAAMRYLIHGSVFLASGCSVATTDDGDGTLFGCPNDCIHERFSASLELAHLKDAHRTVPNNCLRCVNRG